MLWPKSYRVEDEGVRELAYLRAVGKLEQQVVGAARTVRGGTGGRPRRPVSVVLLMILADKGDSGLGSSRQCCLREGG